MFFFVGNSPETFFYFHLIYLNIRRKVHKIRGIFCCLPFAVNVMLNFFNNLSNALHVLVNYC